MNFQEEFSHYLISGDHSALKHYIEGDYDPRILSVYRNGFYKACIEALAANYPVTKILFGEEHFNFLAQRHVQQQPPEQGTLVGYGDDFIETVKAVYVQQGENLPQSYADIAMLDRAWITCLNGADDINNLSAERIQQLATGNVNIENLEVKLSNNVFIQSLDPQAFNFWFNSRYPEQTIEEMPPTAQCHLLIWRLAGQVQIRKLDASESCFFSLAHKQKTLAEIIEATLSRFPDFNTEACFAACLQNQLLSHNV